MQPTHRDKRVCIEPMSSQAVQSLTRPHRFGKDQDEMQVASDRIDLIPSEDVNAISCEQTPQVLASISPINDLQPPISQLDGPQDYRPQMVSASMYAQTAGAGSNPSNVSTSTTSDGRAQKTSINDILPYCTAEMSLTQNQVIALSDIAGNLKEVMLLALQARVDEHVAMELVRTVGEEGAKGIVDFFSDEFEVGGF